MKTKSKLAEHIDNALHTAAIAAVIGFGLVCFRLGQIDMMSPRRF